MFLLYNRCIFWSACHVSDGPEGWEEVAVGGGEGVDKVGQGHHQEDPWPQQVNQKTNNQPVQPMN